MPRGTDDDEGEYEWKMDIRDSIIKFRSAAYFFV